MTTLQVYDPPMCCSTGICGPSVDPALIRFAADLDWLKSQGVHVQRYNLSQEPMAFVENEAVKSALGAEGNDCLPMILVEGKTVFKGSYPESREQLVFLLGLEAAAQAIKETSTRHMTELTERYVSTKEQVATPTHSCCGAETPQLAAELPVSKCC